MKRSTNLKSNSISIKKIEKLSDARPSSETSLKCASLSEDKYSDKQRRHIQSFRRMKPNEDLFSTPQRFERSMTLQEVDRYKWVPGLEYALNGVHLERYYSHVDTYRGDFIGLTHKLLCLGGYHRNNCLDTLFQPFNPSGTLSSNAWVAQYSHKCYTLLRPILGDSEFSNDSLRQLTDSISAVFLLHTLSDEGRDSVLTGDCSDSHAIIHSLERFVETHSSTCYKHFPRSFSATEHNYSHSNRRESYSNSYSKSSNQRDHSEYHSSVSSEKQEKFVPTCHRCGKLGHIAPNCFQSSGRTFYSSQSKQSNNSNPNSKQPSSSDQSSKKEKKVKRVVSDSDDNTSMSDEPVNLEYSNRSQGKPKHINLVLDGTVCDSPCQFQLDSGADVSIVSTVLVPPDWPVHSHLSIKGIDNISQLVPCYALPVAPLFLLYMIALVPILFY